MLKTSDFTVAVMGQGRDNIMMVACLALAITCFALAWVMAVVPFTTLLKSSTIRTSKSTALLNPFILSPSHHPVSRTSYCHAPLQCAIVLY